MEPDEREDETLEILHQVVECAQTLGILGVVDVDQRSDLRRGERNVFVAANDFQLLGGDEGRNRIEELMGNNLGKQMRRKANREESN